MLDCCLADRVVRIFAFDPSLIDGSFDPKQSLRIAVNRNGDFGAE